MPEGNADRTQGLVHRLHLAIVCRLHLRYALLCDRLRHDGYQFPYRPYRVGNARFASHCLIVNTLLYICKVAKLPLDMLDEAARMPVVGMLCWNRDRFDGEGVNVSSASRRG
jgi:hypothetical protein